MQPIPSIRPECITDTNGKRKGVILTIEEYQELLEDIEDLAVLAERREEPTISHEDLVADLKRHGPIPCRGTRRDNRQGLPTRKPDDVEKASIEEYFEPDAHVYLFGSRVDD